MAITIITPNTFLLNFFCPKIVLNKIKTPIIQIRYKVKNSLIELINSKIKPDKSDIKIMVNIKTPEVTELNKNIRRLVTLKLKTNVDNTKATQSII